MQKTLNVCVKSQRKKGGLRLFRESLLLKLLAFIKFHGGERLFPIWSLT